MNTENNIKVSIVIVCMNNLKNLYPCLESIRKYTHVSYETFVVAYLFTPENLERVKANFQWVTFIESNEIRGFSENNNLALRQAHGEYCFVVNDDTEMKMPVIDHLIADFDKVNESVAIISPNITYGDGRMQCCGRGHFSFLQYIMNTAKISQYKRSPYVNQQGLFKSWNILGAAFLIKTKVFKDFGWFDERYFFCPEDVALSENLNRKGYECWVDTETTIIHYGGLTSENKKITPLNMATIPSEKIGLAIMFSEENFYKGILVRFFISVECFFKMCYYGMRNLLFKDRDSDLLCKANKNVVLNIFSKLTPKDVFIKFYKTRS